MSVLLKKSVSAIEKKDVENEFRKLDEIEQDIECSICQCVYTDPVMIDPCMHLYCEACIKSWSSKENDGPKCKETIKGTTRKPDIEPLLELYQKLVTQEKAKIQKIKKLVEEREKMQEKINSILDQSISEPPKRPQTAAPNKIEVLTEVPKTTSAFVYGGFGYGDDSINGKICKNRPVAIPLNEYAYSEFSPISLCGNLHSQNLLSAYIANNGLTLEKVYQSVVNNLSSIDVKKIQPDGLTPKLKPTDSAGEEGIYEFAENGIYYYAVTNKHLIDTSGIPDCGAGAFCGEQYDYDHCKSYNHFMQKY